MPIDVGRMEALAGLSEAASLPAGTKRVWAGLEYVKQPDGEWVRTKDGRKVTGAYARVADRAHGHSAEADAESSLADDTPRGHKAHDRAHEMAAGFHELASMSHYGAADTARRDGDDAAAEAHRKHEKDHADRDFAHRRKAGARAWSFRGGTDGAARHEDVLERMRGLAESEGFPVGTKRTWGGFEYVKTADGDWERVGKGVRADDRYRRMGEKGDLLSSRASEASRDAKWPGGDHSTAAYAHRKAAGFHDGLAKEREAAGDSEGRRVHADSALAHAAAAMSHRVKAGDERKHAGR